MQTGSKRQAIIVADLGFGDSGKGSVIDFLAREHRARAVVRFNGGPQAAHNVVTPGGRHHTFAQLGSGTFVPGCKTHLSNFVLVNPLNLMMEEFGISQQCGIDDALQRLTIDFRCPIITNFQRGANRIREESRGDGRHGSCGEGVGEMMADITANADDIIYAAELGDHRVVKRKLRNQQDRKLSEVSDLSHASPGARAEFIRMRGDAPVESLAQAYLAISALVRVVDENYLPSLMRKGTILFEGAQGVLLDEWFGFHPYTTWSTTTFANAMYLLSEYEAPVTKLGILRAFTTRHGPGPMPTEDAHLSAALADPHNKEGRWQGGWRVGHPDHVLARYALQVAQPDVLGITHLDRIPEGPWKVCEGYLAGPIPVRDLPIKDDLYDLDHQESLTGLLNMADPVYREVAMTRDHATGTWAQEVAEGLGIPLGLTSYGETANTKHCAKALAGQP